MELKLERPIVFFDLETTGTNITRDRIVELSYIKVYPDGREEEKSRRLNPEMHIPEESTAVHHITDADVADAPTRAGLNFDITGRRFVDVQNIFHKMEQRTLVAAYRFYCGGELENAHSAMADTRATYDVLKGQLDRYDTLQNDVAYLADFSKMGNNLDLAARIVEDANGVPVFNFGKHKGKPVKEVLRREPSFYDWMMQGDFPKNTKDVLFQLKYKYDSERKKS